MSRDVGVGQLVEELEQRGDRLPFEIGAFVALEACEGLLQDSVKLEPDDVRVTLEGSVVVADSATSADPDEAARSLVSVLARLLVAAGPGVPPYLLQLVKESTTGESSRDLKHLHDAIEASLIPINRGASRRVLARLVRESDRPPAPDVPQIDPHELDAELDELLRDPSLRTLESTRSNPPVQEPRAQIEAEAEAEIEAAIEAEAAIEEEDPITERIRIPQEIREPSEPMMNEPLGGALAAAPAAERFPSPKREFPEPVTATIRKWQPAEELAPEPSAEPELATAAEPVLESTATTGVVLPPEPLESTPSPEVAPLRDSRATTPPEVVHDRGSLPQTLPKRRAGLGVWLLVAALGFGVYGLVATGALQTLLQPAPPAAAPTGSIEVTVSPADSQIFVFVGRGPALAHELTVGRSHEFVVFGDGLRPARASVPEGATWSTSDNGPLYELAVQPQRADSPAEAIDLGEPLTAPTEPSDASDGSVRVVTNPPGAKVYRFVGKGPSATLSVASIHEGQEVLVHHPSYETRRAVIGPSDWEKASDGYSAKLAVDLPALPASALAQPVED